jgi:DNA-binding transcriptional regulator of glucitol operon
VEVLIWIFLLIAAMWIFQLYLAVQQSRRFSEALKEIRTPGTTTMVGMGGKRYVGGRAFVALAHIDQKVTGAKVLSGLTVFSNAKNLDAVVGMSLQELSEGNPIPGHKPKVALAAKNAADTLLK